MWESVKKQKTNSKVMNELIDNLNECIGNNTQVVKSKIYK